VLPAGAVSYQVIFDRIGRNHDVEPLLVVDDDFDQLAAAIHRHARRFLGSRTVGVSLSLDDAGHGGGVIICGVVHCGGRFRVEKRLS
jgi:hypothetical protein